MTAFWIVMLVLGVFGLLVNLAVLASPYNRSAAPIVGAVFACIPIVLALLNLQVFEWVLS